jgi:long-chain fatty acid transport protein
MSISRRLIVSAAVSLPAILVATSGYAAGFALREQSATAQGLSFAGVASGSGGLSSMYWNPATITMNPGFQSQFNASIIAPTGHITPLVGTSPALLPLGESGDFGITAAVPATYSSFQLNDQLWFGISTNSPFGLTTKSGPVWAGETYARTTKVLSFDVNPVLGWKVNEWLSIAAGPTLQYLDLNLKRALAPGSNPPSLKIDADDADVGFTAGVNITPWVGTDIGVGYRSTVHHELEGDLKTTLAPGATPVVLKINSPELLTVGVSQQLMAGLTLHAGYEWTNWSRLKTPGLEGPAGLVSTFPLNWKDGNTYSLGLEYQFLPQWVGRVGVAYDDSPVTTETRHPRLPDNDRIWASVGLGYKLSDKLTFDVGYSHLFIARTPIRIEPGHQDYTPGLPFVAEAKAHIDVVSFSVKYRWDDTKVAVPAVAAAPIVRKY